MRPPDSRPARGLESSKTSAPSAPGGRAPESALHIRGFRSAGLNDASCKLREASSSCLDIRNQALDIRNQALETRNQALK